MDAKTGKKCAHPPCTCYVSSSEQYCSAQCAAMAREPEIDCRCTHRGCQGALAQKDNS